MSKYKLIVNENFKIFENFLYNIKEFFQENSNTIHKARNEIKVLEYKDKNLVVKSFKVPNLLNKIIYTFLKKSKACKSYEYALKITDFTPKPIGYIEFYKSSLIDESYFISEKFDYDCTIREPLLDASYPDKIKIFKAFARFTYSLHENNIYHLDYSPGNILIKKEEDEFIFKIVDINRMKFLDMSLDVRLKNFSKLWAKDEDLEIIIKEYAEVSKENKEECVKEAIKFSRSHKTKKNFKKKLKGQKVVD